MSRLSLDAFLVLARLHPDRATHGFALVRELSRKHSGSVYHQLRQLESLGYAVGTWEEPGPRDTGRPPRRNYRRTELGTAEVNRVIDILT